MSNIDEVKQRLDIVDIVGGYVRLDKAGRNLKALCPFHEEKTASFFVFPDRQSWRCFGCGEGGDMFSFVMKKEGLDFSEALKMLAERAGVSLERKRPVSEDKYTNRLLQLNEEAAQYYHDLLNENPLAEHARDYVNKRELTPEAVADFQLGYSSGDGLKKHLTAKGYSESELLSAGLIGEKDGRRYDLFRNRLIFPIRDMKSRVVGFGARALDDSQPKYLNSPQTAVFDKSGILYGIDRAKKAIREDKMAVIVEGYLDVISAHQHGFANVVASMGTSLTEKQVRVLRGIARILVFALDPDVAGESATLRGIEVARGSLDREVLEMPTLLGTTSRLSAEMRIISLPQGKDPDDVIREDPQEWQRLVDNALPLMEHIINVTASKLDLSKPEGKSEASEQLLPMIAELGDETQREFYLGKLAGLLGVREKVLLDKAAGIRPTRREKVRSAMPRPASVIHAGDPLEERCLSLLIRHDDLRDKAGRLLPEHFERSENREIFIAWRDSSNVDDLYDMINPDLQGHLEMLLLKAEPPVENRAVWEEELVQCIGRLEERRLKLQDEFLTAETIADIKDGEELDSAQLADLQQKSVGINIELVKRMQERTSHSISSSEE